jgi:hypothetical protein
MSRRIRWVYMFHWKEQFKRDKAGFKFILLMGLMVKNMCFFLRGHMFKSRGGRVCISP